MFATARQWVERRPGALFFLIGWLTTILVMPATVPAVADSAGRELETHWMWSGANPGGQLKGRDGVSFHWWYGVGQSLALLPADFIVSKLCPQLDAPGDEATVRARQFSKYVVISYLTYPVINGWVLAAAFAVLTLLGMSRRAAGLGTLALQFATSHLWHCQNNQENPLMLSLTLAGLAYVLRWLQEPRAAELRWAGFFLGWNLLVRLPNVALIAGVMMVPLVTVALRGEWTRVKSYSFACARDFLPAFAAIASLDRVWHWWRFGSWTETYLGLYARYVKDHFPQTVDAFPFQAPFWDGLWGAAFSPGKSAFLYDPLLALCLLALIVGWRLLRPELRATAACGLAALLVTWFGYARFFVWSGDAAWGNRYGATPVHLLALLGIPAAVTLAGTAGFNWLRRLSAAVVGVSLACQLVSLAYPAWVEMVQAGYRPTNYSVFGGDDPHLLIRHADTFRLGRRWQNLAADLTGNFEAWGLDRTRDGQTIGLHGVMLVPFLPFGSLPKMVTVAVRVAWGAGFITLLAAVRIALREAPESSPRTGVETSS